jgi:hypothetical protein
MVMKIIDCSPEPQENIFTTKLKELWRSIRFGNSWREAELAKEKIIKYLQGVLNNRFFMLLEVQLDGFEEPIPAIIVGPTGIHVINISAVQGVFRGKEDGWQELDTRKNQYVSVKPNLISRTAGMARSIETYFERRGFALGTEPALILTSPGIHVELESPKVRVILADSLQRFVNQLVQGELVLDSAEVQNIVDVLNTTMREFDGENILAIEQDEFDYKDEYGIDGVSRIPTVDVAKFDKISPYIQQMPFTSRQWAALGVLVLVNVVVLAVLAAVILFTT